MLKEGLFSSSMAFLWSIAAFIWGRFARMYYESHKFEFKAFAVVAVILAVFAVGLSIRSMYYLYLGYCSEYKD